MPDRRGTRFITEAAFLVVLAAGVAIAELGGLEIAGIMLLGWAIVAVIEWAAWRETPHYGHGLPPRYYVPRINLPPPQALEQVAAGYPEAHRDEAPTWIASAELRAELLGEWPVAPAGEADAPGTPDEDTQIEPPPVELPPVSQRSPSTPDTSKLSRPKLSRHSLDPLADDEPEPRRFGRRARSEEALAIDVPERPPSPRPLPGSLNPPVE